MFRSPATWLTAAAMLIVAMPTWAQDERGSRLPSGLFGGGVGDTEQLLSLGVSGGGGVNRTGQLTTATTLQPSRRETFGHAAGNLAYSLVRTRVGLSAGVSSAADYYSNAAQQLPVRHVAHAGASFAVPVTGRTTLNLAQSLSYQPVQTVSLFPSLLAPGVGVGPTLPIDPDLATTSEGYLSANSSAGVSYQLARRSAVSMDAGYQRRQPVSGGSDLSVAHAGGRYSRELTRSLGLRLGYAYTRGVYGDEAQSNRFDHHHIDLGVDYGRALSLTRQTTLAFSTGSVVLSDGTRHRFNVNGHVRLSHALGRRWQASAAYRRSTEFLGTLRAPVAADGVSAGLSGMLGSRVHAHGTVGAARGSIGLSQGNSFTSTYASTGVTVGLTRNLGVSVTYAYFRSDFATPVLLAPGVPDQFDRQSLRASVRLWAPLISRVRRPNAAG